MDPVGFVASIITLADLSFEIVHYLKDVKEGGKSRGQLEAEVTNIWLVLRQLQQEFDPPPKSMDEPWMKPFEILRGPGGILNEMRDELSDLDRKLRSKSSRIGNALMTVRWPFEEKHVLKIIERLHRLQVTASLILTQSSHLMSQEILTGVTKADMILEDSHFEKVLSWLSPLNFVQTQQEVLGNMDSYEWILDTPEFKPWHTGAVRSLWCYGAPGSGKSVLAASIYAELTKIHDTENVAVMVAFCIFDNEMSQKPEAIAANLLKQLLQVPGNDKIRAEVKELHKMETTRKKEQKLGLNRLIGLIQQALQTFDLSFIVLDGLDEVYTSSDRGEILEVVHSFGPRSKVMITSRPSHDIAVTLDKITTCRKCNSHNGGEFWRCSSCMIYVLCEDCYVNDSTDRCEKERTHNMVQELRWNPVKFEPRPQDLRTYVSRRADSETSLRDLLNVDKRLRDTLIRTVVEKSGKLFLLARLQMDSLADCLTIGDLRKTLNGLSLDLDEIYFEAFARMKRGRSQAHQQVLQKLLIWISWVHRPLSVPELGHALAIRPGLEAIDNEDIMPIKTITTWSAGLIFIDSKNIVHVIHPTTGSFLEKHRDTLFPNGESVLAHACLDYLKVACPRRMFSGPEKHQLFNLHCAQHPFLEYTVVNFARHVRRSSQKDAYYRAMAFLRSESRLPFLQALFYLDQNWSIESDASVLHITTYLGLTDVVWELIKDNEDVNSRDSFGATPLMYAAARGEEGAKDVERLLSAGADPSLACQTGSTALIRAVSAQAEKVVDRLLLEPDVRINTVAHDPMHSEQTALIISIRLGNKVIFEKLLARHDIDVNVRSAGGCTALYRACEDWVSWAVEALVLRHDINIELENDGKYTPLMAASEAGFVEGINMLLDNGANLHYSDRHGGTALMRAADYDKMEAAKCLIKRGLDVKCRDKLGRTVLHSAVLNQSWCTLEYLLKEATILDLNIQDKRGMTALHDACSCNDSEGARLLVAEGARCDIRNAEGRTPVDIAALKRRENTLKILRTAKGYDVPDSYLIKSLVEAITEDPTEIVAQKIEASTKTELSSNDPFEGTPLFVACRYERPDVMHLLLEAGADPDVTNEFGRTPLCRAIQNNSLGCLRVLVAYHANVNISPFSDASLWEYAITSGATKLALCLIENGANIDGNSIFLQVALHSAVMDDSLLATKRLVEAGASIHRKLKGSGHSAIQLAEKLKATKVSAFFSGLDSSSSGTKQQSPRYPQRCEPAKEVDDQRDSKCSVEATTRRKSTAGIDRKGILGAVNTRGIGESRHYYVVALLLVILILIGFQKYKSVNVVI